MVETVLRWSLRTSRDVVVLRKRIEQASQMLGASALLRTRWATAASDVGRGLLEAGGGEAVLGLRLARPAALVLELVTPGLIEPAIADGARRLVSDCTVESDLAGTEIRLAFAAPEGDIPPDLAARLRSGLQSEEVGDDVTALHSEKRRLETALAALQVAKQGRERLLSIHRTVLEVLPDVVWRADDDGHLRYVNPRWNAMTGRSSLRPGRLVDIVIEADRAEVERRWRAAAASGDPLRCECRIEAAGRRERWVLIHGRPHRQGDERREWIGAITDIHDTKLREIESARLGEFRDRMVGVVGHDLRSPLWFIGTAARMLLDHGDDPDRRARYLGQIVDNVERSRRMIDSLLDYTRTQLGAELVAEKAPVDVAELTATLAGQARVTHPEHTIEVRGPESLVIEGDGDRLMQAMGNLVANALNYGDADAPVVLAVEPAGPRVALRVSNRGAPIPPEDLARIFEPFRRAAGDDTRNGRGLGLGLYIVQAIARAHDGEARLTSSADGRISAWIEVPVGEPQRARPPSDDIAEC